MKFHIKKLPYCYISCSKLSQQLLLITAKWSYEDETECDLLAAKVATEDQNSLVDTSIETLFGLWLSER